MLRDVTRTLRGDIGAHRGSGGRVAGFALSRQRLMWLFAGCAALATWYSPISPVALQLADAHIGAASYEESFVRYAKIAQVHWSASIRHQALQRAVSLHRIEGTSEQELLHLLELTETPAQAAFIQAQLGLYYLTMDQYGDGAMWLEKAQQTCPTDSEAGHRLLQAARARESMAQTGKAEKLYERLGKRYKRLGAQADIGLAELLLASGKARNARRYFERAAKRAKTDDLKALAQFGVATCLERMGALEEALVEMDALDLPPRMLDERRDGIRAHQASEIGGM